MVSKKIGIVAKKLNHSLSPLIHNYWSKNNNNKFIYRKYEVQEKDINKFFIIIEKISNLLDLTLQYRIRKILLIFVTELQQEQKKLVL